MHMMSQSRKCSLVWRKMAYHCKLHQQMQTADLCTGDTSERAQNLPTSVNI
ncbi:hypothetical protein HOLleu_40690 [Holothuria leucospilota]|uniref:Uncharacterized protein n=1 Tax=Holothuria leucospilota TaxID=206669 RepID=A0A9Q0YI07_HOLLE|nr:hypothetical protein HOLleu_40690 [Holothuria leucospilota]